MSSLMHQGRATYAFFERNWNLTKRYWAWEVVWLVYSVVNAMSVTYIGVGSHVPNFVLYLVIGTAVWTYLSVTFDGVTDIINMERWEGTIEYTFMAPISRFTHMVGSCLFAVVHGMLFTVLQLGVMAFFFHIDLSHANYLTAFLILLLGSISFIGFGIGTARITLALYGEGHANVLHCACHYSAGVRRLLSDNCVTHLDATTCTHLACDVCTGWFAGRIDAREATLVTRSLEYHMATSAHWCCQCPSGHIHLRYGGTLR